MAWVSPTGHVDPDNAWVNEAYAYDDDTSTPARRTNTPADTYTEYLELTVAALDCDKVRFYYISTIAGYDGTIDIDVYYSAGWHAVYTGVAADRTWVEKTLGGLYSVTKARIRIHNVYIGGAAMSFYEFDFNGSILAPTVTTQAVSDIGFD